MRMLGRISFGIYMWHIIAKIIALSIATRLDMSNGMYFATTLTGYIGLTIILAFLSFRFIEKPWLDRKANLAISDLAWKSSIAPELRWDERLQGPTRARPIASSRNG
jgi:peptidoglycan/LPS O-acetylase OafA/YrhL